MTTFFTDALVRDYEEAAASDTDAYAAWCRALLARGVYPPPSQFEAWFPSLAPQRRGRRAARSPPPARRSGRSRRDEDARSTAWWRCVAALRAQGGTVGGLLADEVDLGPGDPEQPGLAQRAAAGPRAAEDPREYELLLELIVEGSRLHYGPQRVVQTAGRPTSRCCSATSCTRSGSRGWRRSGTLPAVTELADVISLVAQANAGRRPQPSRRPVWEAGRARRRVGGDASAHDAAKCSLATGDPVLRGGLCRNAAAAAVS